MKKILFVITLYLLAFVGFSQPIQNRSGSSVTVQDSRLMAQYNLFLPRATDTASVNKGIDTCGSIVFIYGSGIWYRECSPKRWVQLATGSGSSLTLQQVTDNGSTTTNRITSDGLTTTADIILGQHNAGASILINDGNLSNGGGGKISADRLTSSQFYSLPDSSGIFALLSNIPSLTGYFNTRGYGIGGTGQTITVDTTTLKNVFGSLFTSNTWSGINVFSGTTNLNYGVVRLRGTSGGTAALKYDDGGAVNNDNLYFDNISGSGDTTAYKSWVRSLIGSSIPTLQQVTTAGKVTSDSISVPLIYLKDVSIGNYGSVEIYDDVFKIIFADLNRKINFESDDDGAATIISNAGYSGNRIYKLPDINGNYFAFSVNGQTANVSGAITIPVGTGTVTSVATGFGILGGTITTTGTLKADTTSAGVQTYLRGLKLIDSMVAVNNTRYGLVGSSLAYNFGTSGSVLFRGAAGISQINSKFFFDSTNTRLGIGTNSPDVMLHISNSTSSTSYAGYPAMVIDNANASGAAALFFNRGAGAGNIKGAIILEPTTNNLLFRSYGANLNFQNSLATNLLSFNTSTSAATFGGSITTSAPSGSTARPFKIGDVSVISPTSPNRTIAIDINGTVYYLSAKTTND